MSAFSRLNLVLALFFDVVKNPVVVPRSPNAWQKKFE
jgi:hypothetical protein